MTAATATQPDGPVVSLHEGPGTAPRLAHANSADICRVCRGEATPEHPLFYPCLCSGSIKYVHQECLLEWLKHSRKKYCELCKHPFAFSPVYVEHMPARLPISVVALGLVRTVLRVLRRALRYVYLVTVWLFLMPAVTTATLSMYLGWDPQGVLRGDVAVITVHVGIGLAITAAMVLGLMGLLLLRDYMQSHRLLRVRRRRNRAPRDAEGPAEGENNQQIDDGPVGPNEPTARVDEPSAGATAAVAHTERPLSEATTVRSNLTVATRGSERSSWLQNVVPREYRAYLRRRELYRERFDHAANPFALAGPEAGPETQLADLEATEGAVASASVSVSASGSHIAPLSHANRSVTRPSASSSVVRTADENGTGQHSHWRTSHARGGESPHVGGGSSTSNIIFRDSIRCKVCSSVVCINKEHVVLASQRSREGPVPLASVLQRVAATDQPATVHVDDGQHPVAAPVDNNDGEQPPAAAHTNGGQQPENVNDAQPPPPPPPEEEDAGWNMWFEGDNNNQGGAMTFSEFIGLSGSLVSVLQNALVVVACNLMVMHSVAVVPHFIGRAVFKAGVLEGLLRWAREREMWYAKDEVLNVGCVSLWIQRLRELVVGASTEYIGRLPTPMQADLRSLLSSARTNFVAATDLFRYERGSYVDCMLQMLVGYLTLIAIGYAYKSLVLDRKAKLGGIHRRVHQVLCLLGAFAKVVFGFVTGHVMLPMFCGWVIDASLLPLFSSSFVGRVAFYNRHSFLSQLIHWTVGVAVLINISRLVGWGRTAVFRPGLLYLLTNTSDPEYQPLKEMIVRPITGRIYMVFSTAVLYGVVLSTHLCGFAMLCRLLVPNLTPLNFSFRTFAAEVPYDLLSNLFIKFLSDMLNPGIAGRLTTVFARSVLRWLRLSSYFYGGRYLHEEDLARGRWVFVPGQDRPFKDGRVAEMAKRPVQPFEVAKIDIVGGRETLDPLNLSEVQHHMPIEPRRPRRLPMAQSTRQDSFTKGFTIVYRPNWFQLRVYAFAAALFLLFQAFGMLLFVAPILLGRYVFGLFAEPETIPYEFHTFQIGVILLGVLIKAGQMACEGVANGGGLRAAAASAMRIPVVALKAAAVALVMFVLWPALGGIYLMLVTTPFAATLNETPTYPIFTCWILGFMYARLLIMLRNAICSEERVRILDRLATFEGWWDMHFGEVFRRLLVPYTIRALLLIFGPPLAVLLLSPLLDLNFVQVLMLQRWSYLLSLAVPVVAIGTWLVRNARQHFLERIRDDNYLVGRRLHNLERPPA